MPTDRLFHRRNVLKTIGGASIVGLAGCSGDGDGGDGSDGGGTSSSPTDGSDTTSPATTSGSSNLEDSITIYANTAFKPIADAFTEATGVDVNLKVLAGPRAQGKFKTEYQSGTYNMDVLINAVTQTAWDDQFWAEVDATNPDKLANDNVKSVLQEENAWGKVWPFYGVLAGFVSNSTAVSDLPSQWEGLPDRDLRLGTPGFNTDNVYAILRRDWSEQKANDYYPKLYKAFDKFPSNHTVGTQQVISGQLDVQAHTFLGSSLPSSLGPAEVSFPSWTSNHTEGAAVSDKAPHPNAAAAFVEWITSQEGQLAIQEWGGGMPAYPDVGHGRKEIKDALSEYDPDVYRDIYTKEKLTALQDKAKSLVED